MTEYFYSPHTEEHIETATPADWMGRTSIAPPAYDRATQSAFFRDGAWEVETAQPPVAPVPQSVTMRQARLALLAANMLTAVNTAIANMPGSEGEAARIEWEYAQEVRRDSPLVAGLSEILGLTDEALDNLYRTAVGL